jgi:hypothetical protein
MTAHSEWEALAAGHAFNALEPEDEDAFLRHLTGCDRCRRDLESYQGVGAGMAYAAEPAEPPADFGRRIMEAAARERPLTPPKTVPLFREPRRTPRAPREAGRVWQPTFRLASLGTAAAFVLLLALTGWNVMLRGDAAATRSALNRRTAALRCLTAEDSARATLAAGKDRRGTACVGGGRAYVFVDRLTPNDTASSVYVFWYQDRAQGLHAVAPFDVPESGTALFELPMNAGPDDVQAVAISLEPGRGMPTKPTQQIAFGAVGG